MTVTIRPARWYHYCHPRNVRWMNDPTVTEFLAKRSKQTLRSTWQYWRSCQHAGNIRLYAIYADQRHVGNAGFYDVLPDQAELRLVIGDRSVWGKGIGTNVMQAMITEARRLHWKQIMLHVNPKNERAVKLYSKLGFQSAGMVPYPGADDQLKMQLPL
ncbi:MAG: GNAT family N-acetyltransferase [Candidatus Kerfeldbacteria bacterium]|nr:GNAT family N-acetyltransferase [Candidatus Kerfeldbacteria bacterium]